MEEAACRREVLEHDAFCVYGPRVRVPTEGDVRASTSCAGVDFSGGASLSRACAGPVGAIASAITADKPAIWHTVSIGFMCASSWDC